MDVTDVTNVTDRMGDDFNVSVVGDSITISSLGDVTHKCISL